MGLKLKNNASTTLAGAILSTDTTLTVASGTGSEFPTLGSGDWFPLTVVDSSANLETMKCTAISGDVLTVSRGQEGTTAAAFASGSRVDLRLTAAAVLEIQTAIASLNTLAATLAPLADPVLTGTPTAPTATNGTDTTQVATTAFVADALVNGVPGTSPATYSGVPSGFCGFTIDTVAPAGWLAFNDSTMGDASSGSTYANADAQAVFAILYNRASDVNCPILASDGSATTRAAQTDAATAWGAHCRMSLPKVLGRAFAATGAPSSGGVLGAWGLGQAFGEEQHTLTLTETPSHDHGYADPGHGHQLNYQNTSATGAANYIAQHDAGGSEVLTVAANATTNVSPPPVATADTGITFNSAGGDGAHNNIQPTVHFTAIIKL